MAGFDLVVDSLPALFKQITYNAGFDPEEKVNLVNFHASNKEGIDLETGNVINYDYQGILDPLATKISIFKIVKELVSQVLKIRPKIKPSIKYI